MTDSGVVHLYLLGLVVALVLVVVAATLVLRVVDLAGGILTEVTRSRRAVSLIEGHVAVIPDLRLASSTTDRILAGALGIEAKVRLVADTLERHQAPVMQRGR